MKTSLVREIDHPQHAVDHGVAHGMRVYMLPLGKAKTMKSNQCRPAYRPEASVALNPR